MTAYRVVTVAMSVLLAAGCSSLQQPPAPADTVSRNLNEMKASQGKAVVKVNERDARIAALEGQLADRDAELARLRQGAGDLSAANRRLSELDRQLAEHDQELGRLRTLVAERDRLAGQLTASSNELNDGRRRLEEATRQIDALNGRVTERDGQIARLTGLLDKGQGTSDELSLARRQIFTLQGTVSEREQELARVTPILKEHDLEHPELDRMKLQVASLTGNVNDRDQEIARLKGLLASRPQPAMVKAEKDLVKALQPEIRAGHVIVGQSEDKLTINLASTLLFDSGQDELKPAGVDVLKRVGGVLKDFPENAVHVAGYTDNVPIRSALKKKFPTNKELSDSRATNAAKLLEASGVSKDTVSAAGHGESQPVADNKTEEGRKKNRRVEIVVSEKR